MIISRKYAKSLLKLGKATFSFNRNSGESDNRIYFSEFEEYYIAIDRPLLQRVDHYKAK